MKLLQKIPLKNSDLIISKILLPEKEIEYSIWDGNHIMSPKTTESFELKTSDTGNRIVFGERYIELNYFIKLLIEREYNEASIIKELNVQFSNGK